MPYTSKGIVPDILLSTISIPNRMLAGLLIELLLSKVMNIKG